MRRFALVLSVIACVVAIVGATSSNASAFVPPGWRQAALHRGIVGRWQLVDVRGTSISFDPDAKLLVLDIGTTTLRVMLDDKVREFRYESTVDEDGMLAVVAYNDSGERVDADVLLETPDAMTIYLMEGDDDIGIAMHFERVR